MISKSSLASFMLMSSVLLSACSNGDVGKNNTHNTNDSSPPTTIAIGMDIAFPPYEYMENSQAAGFDVELMRQILAVSDAQANFIDTRFYNLIPGIKGKKFDVVISGLYITPERMQQVDMIPYYKTTQALVVAKNGNFHPKVQADLCGKTIATQKGTIYPTQLKEIAQKFCLDQGKQAIQVLEFETSPQAIQAVLSKAADAEYDDVAALHVAVKNLSQRIEFSQVGTFYPMFGGIVLRQGDTATRKLIMQGLTHIQKNGEYQKLLASYGLEQPTEAEVQQIFAAAK